MLLLVEIRQGVSGVRGHQKLAARLWADRHRANRCEWVAPLGVLWAWSDEVPQSWVLPLVGRQLPEASSCRRCSKQRLC